MNDTSCAIDTNVPIINFALLANEIILRSPYDAFPTSTNSASNIF